MKGKICRQAKLFLEPDSKQVFLMLKKKKKGELAQFYIYYVNFKFS